MTIEQTIKKAIEWGWRKNDDIRDGFVYDKSGRPDTCLGGEIFLDPSFWQCLGKTMGWGTEPAAITESGFGVQEWLMFWHRFIDHLAEGGSPESFFKEL